MSLADRRRVGKQGRSAPQADLRSNSEKRSFKTGFPEQTGVGLKKMCRKKVQIAANRESRASCLQVIVFIEFTSQASHRDIKKDWLISFFLPLSRNEKYPLKKANPIKFYNS